MYRGAAVDYDRHRPSYPAALLDDLRARVPLRGRGRLLDVACGTGQVAFALAGDVDEVWAVDAEPDMIDFASAKADRLGIGNIRWITGDAETVDLDGAFDLVTFGNAFHRFDRDAIAARAVRHLADGGAVVLLWGDAPWDGERPWQRVLRDTLARWRPPDDRWQHAVARDPHAAVLRRAGLSYEGRVEVRVSHRWSVESLLGFVRSTSFLNRAVLGDGADTFERDLAADLLAARPDGVFEQDLSFAYELARRRPGVTR